MTHPINHIDTQHSLKLILTGSGVKEITNDITRILDLLRPTKDTSYNVCIEKITVKRSTLLEIEATATVHSYNLSEL